ncbi:MAG: hypothetical protein KDK02_09230 [Rhodobacteraceae bacterium]|nr:hypothetical protein [Paracoccaceae bacterium]
MGHPQAISGRSRSRTVRLSLHLLALIGLFAVLIAQATFTGGLWPFDLRFSALIAAGGIALLAIAWWPAALAFAVIAALVRRVRWRLALWPLAVLGMVGLHAAFGPGLGFAPLGTLGLAGVLRLYAIPAALPILAGSALREAFLTNSAPVPPADGAAPPHPKRNTP